MFYWLVQVCDQYLNLIMTPNVLYVEKTIPKVCPKLKKKLKFLSFFVKEATNYKYRYPMASIASLYYRFLIVFVLLVLEPPIVLLNQTIKNYYF